MPACWTDVAATQMIIEGDRRLGTSPYRLMYQTGSQGKPQLSIDSFQVRNVFLDIETNTGGKTS
jgi:hypothetical protein